MVSSSNNSNNTTNYDLSFKVLLIGDSGVGKSSLLVSFISNAVNHDDLSPTIGNFIPFLFYFLRSYLPTILLSVIY